jgi:two-component system, OmpR family, sensor histidine kinase CiaH
MAMSKLRWAFVGYWFLLIYAVAAMFWWMYTLLAQNKDSYILAKQEIENCYIQKYISSESYNLELTDAKANLNSNRRKFYSEGAVFLIVIIVCALLVYKAIKRQLDLNQQQQNFIMAVSHELKTPLAVSKLNMQTLQLRKLDESTQNKLVGNTLSEIERLQDLTQNILAASQLDSASTYSNKSVIELRLILQQAVNRFAALYPNRKFDFSQQNGLQINGVQSLLDLVVHNLLSNANKYSAIDLPIQVTMINNGFKITDYGQGIPPEEQQKVFEKFYRVGNELTRTSKGTGLGLYICKKIVENHNGSIAIENNQPRGTSFVVQFKV